MYRLDSSWSKIVFDDEVHCLNQRLPTSKTEDPEATNHLGVFLVSELVGLYTDLSNLVLLFPAI